MSISAMSPDASPLPAYDFLAPQRIVFGWGRWTEVAQAAPKIGRRALIVAGSRALQANGFFDELQAELRKHQVDSVSLVTVTGEPTVNEVDRATARIRELRPTSGDFVLAVGGGSALDMGKALAAMATNSAGSTVQDYLEGVGRGLTLVERPLPVVAMPTTSGTGSEATKNAVISVQSPHVKKSLRSDALLPALVVVDPQLTVSLPADVTAATGMDAITQLIESYISCRAKPVPRALALSALPLALDAIEIAVAHGQDRPAREAMAHAALLSGMALANSGLGLAHGVAAALGVHNSVSHGRACALMLPVALAVNRDVSERSLAELATACGLQGDGTPGGAADALLARIDQISSKIGMPRRLADVGVRRDQLVELARDSRGNSLDGNPRAIGQDELVSILEQWL